MKKTITFSFLFLFALQSIFSAATGAVKILEAHGRPGGVFVVVGCGDKAAPALAVELAQNGNTLIQALATTSQELKQFQKAIAQGNVKGLVSAEQVDIADLSYRDNLINVMIIMDPEKAAAAGLTNAKAMKFISPLGKLVTTVKGKWKITEKPMPQTMDTWTHHRHSANGNPLSKDKVFDLPIGYRWNAGLPMNFNNPQRGSNRYSSTRGLALNDGKCISLTTAVFENLGPNYRSTYGTDQYLTCRDAFNGLMLWRKKIGGTFYGGLYIENRAPFATVGNHIYLAGDNDTLLVIDIKTGKTIKELPTTYIPGVILVDNGIIVTATWKNGKVLGPIKRYDRRRMDWDISEGTIEAYDQKTLKRIWKNDLLGTSMRIENGKVFIINRNEPDKLEKAHNKRLPAKKGPAAKIVEGGLSPEQPAEKPLTHPSQQIIAMGLKTGKILWQVSDADLEVPDKALRVASAVDNRVIVSTGVRGNALLLSADNGKLIAKLPTGLPVIVDGAVNFRSGRYDLNTGAKLKGKGLSQTTHICTPITYVNDITVANRSGKLMKKGKWTLFGGVRGGCITGSIPAYGSLFSPQNWCKCSPAQIAGLISVGPIGSIPTPQEMEKSNSPIKTSTQPTAKEGKIFWSTPRGNSERSSSSDVAIKLTAPTIAWEQQLTDTNKAGLTSRDWHSYLNSRITPAVIGCGLAIVCDIDQNEVIAVDNNGKIKWRFQTAGRSSTSPTLYKGICLVGDHCGYVYALDILTGNLIYRLRIAPKEIRMLSYGKIESPWPIIGGVMITDGKAYASAGRSQGSDGGIVIRAFNPENGQIIWSKALYQSGNNRQLRNNDMLVKQAATVQLMFNRFDLNNGEKEINPNSAYAQLKTQAKRTKDKEKKKELYEKLKTMPSDIAVNSSVEGLRSWNWTRLGDRKFGKIGYGSAKGHTLSWNKTYAATSRGNVITMTELNQIKHENDKQQKTLWRSRLPNGCLITSLILCDNVLLAGGTISKGDKEEAIIQAIDLKTGKPVWEKKLNSRLAFNGIAVAPEEILVSLENGKLACLK
jgi:outer membrane protein assembly factor BamB